MTWLEKLRYIELQFKVILHLKKDITTIFEYEEAKEIATYLHLSTASTNLDHQGWMLFLFLYAFGKRLQERNISQEIIIDHYARKSNEVTEIANGLDRLGILDYLRFNENNLEISINEKTFDLVHGNQNIPQMSEFVLRIHKAAQFINRQDLQWYNETQIEQFRKYLNELTGYISNKPSLLETLHFYKKLNKQEQLLLSLILIRNYFGLNTVAIDEINILSAQEHERIFFFSELKNDKSALFKNGYIKKIEYQMDAFKFELTDQFIKSQDLEDIFKFRNNSNEPLTNKKRKIISEEYFTIYESEAISEEELHFNEKLQNRLSLYEKLFSKSDEIFTKKALNVGKLNLFFEGPPGSGKTAFAFQLAKKTNRDLILVNWQNIRQKWMGESEKSLMKILNGIDAYSKTFERIPIILFNEAESFLSRRVTVSYSADHTLNTLVSLLLEWLEKKDPLSIVIFTANHKELLDPAFERRLTQISFESPDESTGLKIWKTRFSKFGYELSNDDLTQLTNLNLSGAEIDNLFKSYKLHQLAYEQTKFNLEVFLQYSGHQKWSKSQSIGFRKNEDKKMEIIE